MSTYLPKSREGILQRIAVPAPWSAAVIPVSAFPAPHDERHTLREVLGAWCARVAAENKLIPSTWLQMNHLHLDNGAQKISANGPAWLPMTGLGVWPDHEPPRLWTKEDFLDRDYGQPLPPLMHTVFHISGDGKAADHARDAMLGSGTVVHALLTKDAAEFHEAMRELLLPTITEEALRGHPFYMPLLEAKSVQGIPADLLDAWMGPASVYIRESMEDRGLLIICSLPQELERLLQML